MPKKNLKSAKKKPKGHRYTLSFYSVEICVTSPKTMSDDEATEIADEFLFDRLNVGELEMIEGCRVYLTKVVPTRFFPTKPPEPKRVKKSTKVKKTSRN